MPGIPLFVEPKGSRTAASLHSRPSGRFPKQNPRADRNIEAVFATPLRNFKAPIAKA
jgi:hypothetical protein